MAILIGRIVTVEPPRDKRRFKFYAKDVGAMLALSVSGGSDREELISYQPGN
jgi:hypothetical protein